MSRWACLHSAPPVLPTPMLVLVRDEPLTAEDRAWFSARAAEAIEPISAWENDGGAPRANEGASRGARGASGATWGAPEHGVGASRQQSAPFSIRFAEPDEG